MRDFINHIHVVRAISPQAARTDNTPIVSQIINRTGFDGLGLLINIGANTDANATFAVTARHGDQANLSDGVAVPADQLVGTLALAGFTAADDDNKIRKVGYKGNKTYVEFTITPTGNDAGNIFVDAIAVLFRGRYGPQANPPA